MIDKNISIRSLHEKSLSSNAERAVTIGNFDGCHRGHQTLIQQTQAIAASSNLSALVMSFDPNPKDFFQPQPSPHNLFSAAQKQRALSELGVNEYLVQKFDRDFSLITRETFVNDYLLAALRCRALVVGYDFAFGFRRQGNTAFLQEQSAAQGFSLQVMPPYQHHGTTVSSSVIRQLLTADGNIQQVTELLGRPYLLEGQVAKGKQLGRTIGWPTINVGSVQQLLPKPGIYCGWLWLAENDADSPEVMRLPQRRLPAAISIGTNPTINDQNTEVFVEAYAIHTQLPYDTLYGRGCGIYLTHRLRDEMKFAGLAELDEQIKQDVQQALQLLK